MTTPLATYAVTEDRVGIVTLNRPDKLNAIGHGRPRGEHPRAKRATSENVYTLTCATSRVRPPGREVRGMRHAALAALSIALAVTLHPLPGEAQPAARLQPFNVDAEVARVKKEMRAIQDQPIPREAKVQQQRALIERESASARAKMRSLQAELSINQGAASKETKETKESKEAQDARDRKKAGMDNLQKFLDILRSMNPQI